MRVMPGNRKRDRRVLTETRAFRPARKPGALRLQFEWASAISDSEWKVYALAMQTLRSEGIDFLLGGGFALAAFTDRWRDTKDIDFYIDPRDREKTIRALLQAGFGDYYSKLPYDRKWIFRSVKGNIIVDIIWSMANQRAQVDQQWFERAGSVTIREQQLRVIPPEEFMWCKLFILQRDHSDWTDLFNLLYVNGARIDWEHLLQRLNEDWPLLKAMLTVFAWLCPSAAGKIPAWLWRHLELSRPAKNPGQVPEDRIRWLDSRQWFAALVPPGGKLEI